MPKIRITERDNTGLTQFAEIPNIVYIPGVATTKTEPILYGSRSTFITDLAENKFEPSISTRLASILLSLGMQVLFQGFTSSEGTYEEGKYTTSIKSEKVSTRKYFEINDEKWIIGDNVITLDDDSETPVTHELVNGFTSWEIDGKVQEVNIDFIHNLVAYTIRFIPSGAIDIKVSDLKALEDRNLYNIRFITLAGLSENTEIINAMIKCAANRGDCVALVDDKKPNGTVSTVAEIRTWFGNFDITNINSDRNHDNSASFAAGFTPWFKANLGSGVEDVPASFGYLLAYARSVRENPLWKAVAGTFRGEIPELVSCRDFTMAEVEVLQARASTGEVELDEKGDNVGFAINPIAYVSGYGYLIWGNRTLRDNAKGEDGTGLMKASAYLNCRLLANEVNKVLYRASKKYEFEQNSDVLWFNFKSEVIPTLDRMKSGEGVEDYSFVKLPTSKKARLKARVSITPIEGVEDFDMEILMSDSIEVTE